VHDWNSWLSSNETRTAIRLLSETAEEIKESITDGSHIQEKDTNKISLDYTYSLGQLDGLRMGIQMIKDIKEIIDEEQS
jgi:hypothetical protein